MIGFPAHPRCLPVMFFTEMWERFSFYGMNALLVLYLVLPAADGGLGYTAERAAILYGNYTLLLYLLAIVGGWVADCWIGQKMAVLAGGMVIAAGHFVIALGSVANLYIGLGCVAIGTGFLKPNISSLVGRLYAADDPRRDAGFSLYYMGINLGAFLAPLACGYLGMKNRIEPKAEMKGDAYLSPYSLPRSLGEALDWLRRETDLHEVLGKEFITVYTEIKELEFDEFMKVISPWEREHLLLHV